MKTNKLIAAGAMALSMAMTPVASLINAMPIAAKEVDVTVDISGFDENSIHTFAAYQVFSGNQESDGSLGDIEWGTGIKNGDTLLEAIKGDSKLPEVFKGEDVKTASDVAKKLAGLETGKEAAAAELARLIGTKTNEGYTYLSESFTSINSNMTKMEEGYYLIVDTSTQQQDVVGLSLLQLTGTTNKMEIVPKTTKPTVNKQVKDEVDDAETGATDGWGETADHEIGETFQFKLIANGLSTENIDKYDSYSLKFNDEKTAGVTYGMNIGSENKIADVTTGKVEIVSGSNRYDVTDSFTWKIDANNSNKLTISCDNIKPLLETNEISGQFTVEVTYNASLNEGAQVINSEVATEIQNKNTVTLTYSNNPNFSGEGTSQPDDVYVASFKLVNAKVDDKNAPLAGAGFKLTKTVDEKLYVATFDTTQDKNVFTGWIEATKDDNGVINNGTVITSKLNAAETAATFDMVGLDAGTYKLYEVVTPAGYDTAEPVDIVITATHAENENLVGQVTVTGTNSTGATVINTKNGSLPETGGMGTTLIYGAGALMVAGAAVVYVTNKRTRKD